MVEDITPIDKKNTTSEVMDSTPPASFDIDSTEQARIDESARVLLKLEQKLTPEEMEIILAKLNKLGEDEKQVAIRFMNSGEYLDTVASSEYGKIPPGIEFNFTTIAEIRSFCAPFANRPNHLAPSKGALGYYAENMTSTDHAVADLMRNYSLLLARYSFLRHEAKSQGDPESGRQQFILELKNFVANFIYIYKHQTESLSFGINLFRALTDEEKHTRVKLKKYEDEGYKYVGGLEYSHEYQDGQDRVPTIDLTDLDAKINEATGILAQIDTKKSLTFQDQDIEQLNAVLNKPEEDFSRDDIRCLINFVRHGMDTSEAEGGIFLPYEILLIAEADSFSASHNLGFWKISTKAVGSESVLGALCLLPDKKLFAKIARAMTSSEKPNFYHPILNPRGESVFPSKSSIADYEDRVKAEQITQQIREGNISDWEEQAKKQNDERGLLDKIRKKNVRTWIDVAHDEAKEENAPKDEL